MAVALPRNAVMSVVITPGANPVIKYLNVGVDGTIKANGEFATSPPCQFELEPSELGPDLFHVRSRNNNKYWVKESPDSPYIKAVAAEPNEDTTSWSCTLVQPVVMQPGSPKAFFRLLYRSSNIGVRFDPSEHQYSLYISPGVMDFTVVDRQSLFELPEKVVFKGEDSGKYLAVRTIDGQPHLQFDATDIADPRIAHEIVPTPHGGFLIKSSSLNKYWRRNTSSSWVLVDSNQDKNNKDLEFYPVKAGDNHIALRNTDAFGRNFICRRFTENPRRVSCLRADASSVVREARLFVEEPVLSREVFNFNYRLQDARIYDGHVLTMVNRDHENNGTNPQTTSLRLLYRETTTRTFERSISASVTATARFRAGIPIIAEGRITISATVEGSLKWSDTTETVEEREVIETVTVPPKTWLKASVVATQGRCDVPFSYTVRDHLATGQVLTYTRDDGVYKGVNAYNFKFVTTEEPL